MKELFLNLKKYTLDNVMCNIFMLAILVVTGLLYLTTYVWWLTVIISIIGAYGVAWAINQLLTIPSDNYIEKWMSLKENQKIDKMFDFKIQELLTGSLLSLIIFGIFIIIGVSNPCIMSVAAGVCLTYCILSSKAIYTRHKWVNLQESFRKQYLRGVVNISNQLSKQIKEIK